MGKGFEAVTNGHHHPGAATPVVPQLFAATCFKDRGADTGDEYRVRRQPGWHVGHGVHSQPGRPQVFNYTFFAPVGGTDRGGLLFDLSVGDPVGCSGSSDPGEAPDDPVGTDGCRHHPGLVCEVDEGDDNGGAYRGKNRQRRDDLVSADRQIDDVDLRDLIGLIDDVHRGCAGDAGFVQANTLIKEGLERLTPGQ